MACAAGGASPRTAKRARGCSPSGGRPHVHHRRRGRGRAEREEGIEKTPKHFCLRALEIKPGNDLLSHARARAVPSALEGLTSEFGMGSGMAPPTSSPEKLLV